MRGDARISLDSGLLLHCCSARAVSRCDLFWSIRPDIVLPCSRDMTIVDSDSTGGTPRRIESANKRRWCKHRRGRLQAWLLMGRFSGCRHMVANERIESKLQTPSSEVANSSVLRHLTEMGYPPRKRSGLVWDYFLSLMRSVYLLRWRKNTHS